MQNKDNRKYFEVPYLPAEMLVPVSVVRASIENTEDGKTVLSWALSSVLLVLILLFGAYGIGYDASQFIYTIY